MVAVVTGSGLGLERSSANVLGARGQLGSAALGRANDGVVVNAATGNLVVGNRDEVLIGQGPDVAINRTYNSLGTYAGDTDNWLTGTQRKIALTTGTANTAGSIATLTDWDGTVTTFDFVSTTVGYKAMARPYSDDTLKFASGVWTWTDGKTRLIQKFNNGLGGRITGAVDADGKAVTYTYSLATTAGVLTKITTANSTTGQLGYTELNYGDNPLTTPAVEKNLLSLKTSYFDPESATNKTLTRTLYSYDASNRLATVTVDLSPGDSAVADGKVYTTTYTYVGATKLVASIAQTDGSLLQIGYDGSNRVSTLTETVETGVTRTTSFAYGTNYTTVTDPQGNATLLAYDGLGQLTRIDEPAPAGGDHQLITTFSYDGNGNPTYSAKFDGWTNANSDTALTRDWYRYDANGNLTDRADMLGNTTRWTYGSKNEVLTMTAYTGVDPDGLDIDGDATDSKPILPTGGMITRYAYDAENHLRFAVTPEGSVTEYRYDAVGNLIATIDWAANLYPATSAATLTPLTNWVSATVDKSKGQRTDYSYDFRGNLASTTSYASTDTAGTGIFDVAASRTYYIYDQAGNLLTKRVDDGSSAETYAYDGMGRTIRFTDAKGVGTWTSYIDNQARTVVTLANGLTQTSAYNKVGELLTFSEARGGFATPIAAASSLGGWNVGGLTAAAAGTLDGAPAIRYTVPSGSGWSGIAYDFNAVAGETYTSTVSLQAVGTQNEQLIGLYGQTSGWGSANISSARIISGPGTLTIWQGGLWKISGLSTTESTRIEVTRTYTISESAGAYVYVDILGGYRAGQELIVGAPSVIKARYDESGTIASFDAGQFDINNWGYGGATREAAGSIDGSPASKFTVQSTGQWTAASSLFVADAGDTVTTAMSMMATGTSSAVSLGIYGDSSGWSFNAISTARIVSGPGTLTQEAGGLWNITSLSTTQVTRIEITRTFMQREGGGVYFYPDRPNGWVAGHAIIVGAPSIVKTPGDLTSYKYDSLGRLRIRSDPAGKRSFFFYDKQGRKIGDVAADGAVADYKYDAAGRVIATVQYATALSSVQLASLFDGSGNPTAVEFSSLRPTSTASDRWGWTIYDKAGRAVETIDAVGMTTQYVYDGAGRIKYQWKRYNTLSQSQLDGFKATPPLTGIGPADHANDRITQFYYDGDGLLIGSMDEEMYLTQNIYDAAGRKIETLRYNNRSNPSNRLTDSWASLLASAGTHPKDEHSYWLYDGRGLIGATIDGEGNVTRFGYDARGNLIREERGQQVTANTSYTLATLPAASGQLQVTNSVRDALGQLTGQTQLLASGNLTSTFAYDVVGNLTSATDARANQATRYYDARGRLVREDVPLDATTVATTRYEYDSRGNVVRTIDARGNAACNYYDDRSRLVLQIDAEGYATETTYSVFGEVASVRRYYDRATNVGYPTVRPTLTTNAKDAITSFIHDNRGDVTVMSDAEGGTETYFLDAFGQTYFMQNKLGGETSYTFDRRGLLYYANDNRLAFRNDGSTQATGTYKVLNVYDAFGNLVQLVEGNGLTERRDTYYTYDRNNRLIRTDLPAFSVFDAPTGADVLTTPYETYKYDGRGNLIETVDAGGGRSLSYYDEANRRVATIDAVGTHRTFGYDANGNVTVERVYSDASPLPGVAGGMPPAPLGTPREILYAYDRSNRLIEKRVPSVQTGQLVGTVYQRPVTNLVTTYTYDANGNAVRETDARGNSVLHWYDRLGREIGRVDQEGYITYYGRDSEGNVLREHRVINQITVPFSETSNFFQLFNTVWSPQSESNDRITDFQYDRMGRRLAETRHYVTAGTISGASATVGLTPSVIYYTYNAFGEVLSKTEATGDQSVYQYDSYGRLTRKLDPGLVDHAGANVRRATDLSYDGLDNLVREVSMEGNTAADAHVTRYVYGTGGRLKSVIDAAGGQHNYQYNIKGELRRDQVVTQRSGGSSINFEKFRDYDAVGRVIVDVLARWEPSTGWVWETTQTTNYNAYGDVVSKGVNGSIVEQLFYDNAGRLVKSSAGDGVWKFFVYDANGNVTLSMISTAAADLGTQSQLTILDTLTDGSAGDIYSLNQYLTTALFVTYDKRNLATETYEPNRTVANMSDVSQTAATTLNTRKWYNAFGEVTQDRNARGYITNYSYNTMGRVTQLQAPETDVGLENGTVVRQRPTENYVYDISGRLIGTQNANGSWTTRSLLAGSGYGSGDALVTAEYRPDGSVWQTKYDVHGNARKLIDGLNRITTQSFDAANRLTQVVRPSGLTDNYAYDALGQRTRHWNNIFSSPVYGTPVWVQEGHYDPRLDDWVDTSHWYTPVIGSTPTLETNDYDMTGRVISAKTYAGDVANYTYSWSGGIVTSGLGSFGGWTKTTSTIADRYATNDTVYAATETTDAFGRMVARTDMGGNSFSFAFNEAGQLVSETGGGNTRSYTYFNTGQLAQSISGQTPAANTNWRRTTVDYRADAEGHRVYEKTTSASGVYTAGSYYPYYVPPSYYETSALLADGRATYDEMGRMKTWSDRNASGVDTAAVTWTYDAAGNVRSMSALYKAINADGSQAGSDTSQTYWYRYDALNRMVTTKGALSGGTIVRGATGIDLTYNAVGARAQMITGSGYGQKLESYTYFADGGLDQVSIAEGYGAPVLRADTSRDLLGRVDGYVEYNAYGSVTHERYAIQYDLRGQLLTEKTRTLSGSDWIYAHTVNDYSATGAGTPGGEVYYGWYTGSSTGSVLFNARSKQWKNGSNPPSFASSADYDLADTYTTYTYGPWRDAAVQVGIVLTNRDGTATSSYAYANDGSLTSVSTSGGAHPRTVAFTNDQQGRVLERVEADYNYSQSDPRERRYRFNGIEMGTVGNNGADDTDYATAIARRNAAQGTGAFRGGATTGTPFADFDQNYAGINPSNERGTGSMWTARSGDTLSGIAAAIWGDASRWYLIAEANGLGGNGPQGALTAGTSLVIPGGSAATNLFNSAGTFKPYDAAKAIGDTQPSTPKPPNRDNGCGVFGQILLAVVAVAVTIIALPAGPVSIGQGILAGLAGGAASNAVGLATGIQDDIDWKGIALAGIGGGVTAALGPVIKGAGFFADALRAAAASAITQGIGVATGLQDEFSWAGVAAAGVGGGVGGWVGSKVGGGEFGRRLAASTAAGLANAATRSVLEGTDFGDNIIAALPDVIGQTVGGAIGNAVVRNTRPLSGKGIQLAGDLPLSELGISPDDIVVTAKKWKDQAIKIGQSLGDKFDRFFDFNFFGNNPHKKSARDRAYEANLIIRSSSGPSYRNNEEGSYLFAADHPVTGAFTIQSRVAFLRAGDTISGLVNSNAGSRVGGGLNFLYENTLGPGTPYDTAIVKPTYALIGLIPDIDPGLIMTLESNGVTRLPGFALSGVRSLQSLRAGGFAAESTGIDLALTFKPGWSAAQRADALTKTQILTEADTVVLQTARGSTSAASRYTRSGGTVPAGSDVDHIIDLQLGGADTVRNMLPLNSSVNRSLGAQIQHQIRNLPPGTRVNRVTIGDR